MKYEEITPPAFACFVGACPAVYRTDRGTLLVIGRRLAAGERDQELRSKVGSDEEIIEIPSALISGISASLPR